MIDFLPTLLACFPGMASASASTGEADAAREALEIWISAQQIDDVYEPDAETLHVAFETLRVFLAAVGTRVEDDAHRDVYAASLDVARIRWSTYEGECFDESVACKSECVDGLTPASGAAALNCVGQCFLIDLGCED